MYKIIIMKNWLGAAILLLFILSCQNDIPKNVAENAASLDGKTLYKERCVSCHGVDGKLGFAGAKDLTQSSKSVQEIVNQVMNGKGAMTAYKNILTSEEIEAVSLYAASLQKK